MIQFRFLSEKYFRQGTRKIRDGANSAFSFVACV